MDFDNTMKLNMIVRKWMQKHGISKSELKKMSGYDNVYDFLKGGVKHIPPEQAEKLLQLMPDDELREIASEFNWKEIPYYAS